ncbi:MAG TPA: AAA family ATPase, partial [Actinomycetota bacterium]|nr:AAA family ATPase [Actinomycetota bacterium]
MGASDVSRWVPKSWHAHVHAGGFDVEHRNAVVAFILFSGTDSLLASEGADALGRALDDLVGAVQELAAAHQLGFLGTDLAPNGAKAIVAGGLPENHGDNDGRVLRAMRELADRSFAMPVQIGINRGRVFCGEIGPKFSRTYAAMGDTMNLAARVMAAAKPGQVLATRGVLDHSRTEFAIEAVPPFRAKGKSKLVESFEIIERRGERGSVSSRRLPLVGRDGVLDDLIDAWNATRAGNPQVIELIGNTGLGKTRLVHELLDRTGAPGITVTCEPFESAMPFSAARSLLRGALGVAASSIEHLDALVRRLPDEDLRSSLPLIAPILGFSVHENDRTVSLEARFRRQLTIATAARLLESALDGKYIVAVEDVDQIDDASSDLIAHLCRSAEQRTWLMILTRTGDATGLRSPAGARAVTLDPLDEASAARLLELASEDRPPAPHVREALLRRAGGNPFFLEELVRLEAADVADALPESLESIAAVRIDALPPAERRLLRYASAAGM